MIFRLLSFATAGLAAFLCSCSSGGGGGGDQAFGVFAVNVTPGVANWKINRAIRVTFNQAVDPTSVTHNSVQVRLVGGSPAFGTPLVDPADPRSVLWRPLCPTEDDLSDAGLLSGVDPATGVAYQYELNVIGADKNAGFTVRSVSGRALEQSVTRFFTTPTSQLFSNLFVDDVTGPPLAIVRPAGSTEVAATRLWAGSTLHYFERQPNGQVTLVPPLELPLNLLSDPGSQVELLVQFNQSVDMRSSNIHPDRLRWEYESGLGVWTRLAVEMVLEENCTETGALVSIRPAGLLPPGSDLRAVVATQFSDIIGEKNVLPQERFADTTTRAAPAPPQLLADDYLEEFVNGEREDSDPPFSEPRADWGGGELRAKFSFTGGGGPGGDFDWKVATGEILIVNTSQASITGGPGYFPSSTQTVLGGVFDVRNLWVEAGGTLIFEGPNPVTIFASGDVLIDGLIDLGGTKAPGVVATNTTFLPIPGSPGQCGGGRGGTGSAQTAASTWRGDDGFGAFDTQGGGGQGGETGWATKSLPQSLRRGAGGGGGVLGSNVAQTFGPAATFGTWDQSRLGLDAEQGFSNPTAQFGSFSGPGGPIGGNPGPGPFVDPDPGNDFFGSMFDAATGKVLVGELKQPWAGAGGGGGGDASRIAAGTTFPGPWKPAGDERGAGGGGGAGSLRILTLGNIRFGLGAKLLARGGSGGGGENNNRFNRVGGGSGGGSGGHVILESAASIDFSQNSGVSITATGGQGGAGESEIGGAFPTQGGMKETPPQTDACPPGYPTNGSNACRGHIDGAGGDGGPGIVQLHTSSGTVGIDILLPAGAALSDVTKPPAVCAGSSTCFMIPSFGRNSRARSEWIALGEGGFDNGTTPASYKNVVFDFAGIDPGTGLVQTDASERVVPGAVLLSATQVLASGHTFTMDGTQLLGGPDEVLLANPGLLRHFLLELRDTTPPGDHFQRFDVVSAAVDPVTHAVTLTVDGNGPVLSAFQSLGPVDASLQRAHFRIVTDGVPDSLPSSAAVQIRFEATVADASGGPEEGTITVPLTSDVDLLNNDPRNAELRYVRFEVLFDVDALLMGLSPTSPIPAATHLRMPFRYP